MSNITQSQEVWKVLQECKEYEISNFGRIKRIETGYILAYEPISIRLKWKAKFKANTQTLLNKYFPEQKKDIPDLEKECWKDVSGYEGLYKVSNKGRIKTVPHIITRSNGRLHTVKEKLLSERYRGKAGLAKYQAVRLYSPLGSQNLSVHRLVAVAFVPNPESLPVVNHKDGNKLNNNDWNLEWGTVAYNNYHADNVLKSREHVKIKIDIMKDGVKIHTADSVIHAAAMMDCSRTSVRNICIGKRKHYRGYVFSFAV